MARVKRGTTSHAKHKKLLNLTKGHRGGRSKLVKQAHESALHAGMYAFAGRKHRQRDMRRLWITQINIALDNQGLSYSKVMHQLSEKGINLDRKMLAELAVHHPEDFQKVISQATA